MNSLGPLSALQYIPGNSLLHRLDPRSKYGFVVSYSINLASSHSLTTSLVYTFIALLLFLLSKLHLLTVWKNIRGLVIVLLILNYFQFRLHGIEAAALLTLKMLSFFLLVTLMLSTTPPEKQMEGLHNLLSPLRRLGVKTESFVFMFTIAVVYLPLLLEDFMRIMQAQRARGPQPGRWNLPGRGKDMFLLLNPLLFIIFRRAERLSEAMESRCYCPGCDRTAFYQLKLGKHDIIVLLLALLFAFVPLYFE
ncbi:energy-coupling factor transport system permease protein [Paenibacillus sophorae]|uniref:Energy-coupling factor transport system permease protein n=1 Tax=Paenibacillus sophorae TaxID=1333845 RepID=A0A1H8SX38_9BACL|nr:energy-coupling factor transporter transmembrane component T [Paenibacillus sophorae]QWU15593.1 energy-coupling factor transporter transmembrane protein EcfT [Paenibacillus sophorae]SEO83187.1 energy-coupling factor transport system permease protein [Paenibacillus sophorae]